MERRPRRDADPPARPPSRSRRGDSRRRHVTNSGALSSGPRPRLPAHLVPIRIEHGRPPRPLTREQAAERLGLHPRTLDRWVRRGRLRVIDLRGTVRIPETETARVQSIAAWTRFD